MIIDKMITANQDAPNPEGDKTGKSEGKGKASGLSEQVLKKLDAVRAAFQSGKKAGLGEAKCVYELRVACDAEGLKYLEVCKTHLKDLGQDAISEARLSKLCDAYSYLKEKAITIPKDVTDFPPYSIIAPLNRFIRRGERARKLQKEWDELHASVFQTDATKRPTAAEIAEKVAALFAPPEGSKVGKAKKPTPGLEPEIVKPEGYAEWAKNNATDGNLIVHRIRVARMTTNALAAAIQANWKSLKTAKLVKIEVGK